MGDKEQLSKLATEVAEHRGKVDEFIHNTVGYRKDLCGKLEEIRRVLTVLPCREREARYIANDRQLKFMWGVLTFFVVATIGIGVNSFIDRDDMKKSLHVIKTEMIQELSKK